MENKKLKVAHFSFGDDYGAFGAAYELHRGLLQSGIESSFFVRKKSREDDSILEIGYCDSMEERLVRSIDKLYFEANRVNEGVAPFSFDYIGIPWNRQLEKRLKEYDIFHIHWVAGFLSIDNVYRLSKLNRPIVWTMHDFHPFTGGCHCPEMCIKYQENCSNCHELKNDNADIVKYILREKQQKYSTKMRIIVASKWLKDVVKHSKVFHNNKCEVIPIGIDTNCFIPKNKLDMKGKIGLSGDTKVILVGAQSLEQNVKGYVYLKNILQFIKENDDCKQLIKNQKIVILTFGHNGKSEKFDNEIPTINMGFIRDRETLCEIYNAADVFVFPSIQDTFGMTAVEAMSCGVPAVAFNVGAMSDVIISGINGYKAEVGEFSSMASHIVHILTNNPISTKLCRKRVTDDYSLEIEVGKMTHYYQECLSENDSDDNLTDMDQKESEVQKFIHKCAFEILTGTAMNQYRNMGLQEILLEYNPEFVSPEEKINKLIQNNSITQEMSVYVYGAGELGRKTVNALERNKIGIAGFLDFDERKERQYLNGYCIYKPNEKANSDGKKIIIAGINYLDMIRCLHSLGYVYKKDFF